MNRLKEKYLNEVRKTLKEELKLKSDLAVPKLEKVVINVGSSEAKESNETLERIIANLKALSGQQPVVTKAKKSISAFKLTKGAPVGVMVTLRGEKMYAFLDKLMNNVLPKVRDFRGVSADSFDNTGNYNLGLREQLIFPEAEQLATTSGFRGTDKIHGLQITIAVINASKEQGKRLLELLGMPFRR